MNTIKEDISPQKINIKKKRVYWTVKKDKLLLELVKSNGVKLNWKELTANFNMTFKQCYDRYININPLLKKGSWSDEEERKLKGLVGIYGEKWSQISKEFGGTRSGKQIRFHCKHMPELNGKKWSFTEEDDNKLCQLYKEHGPEWKYIALFFKGRSAEILKNRFYNHKNQQNKSILSKESEMSDDNNEVIEQLETKLNSTESIPMLANLINNIQPQLNTEEEPNYPCLCNSKIYEFPSDFDSKAAYTDFFTDINTNLFAREVYFQNSDDIFKLDDDSY